MIYFFVLNFSRFNKSFISYDFNFQYTETIILFHNQKAQKKAEMLSEILNVNQSNIQFNKNSVWDLSVIIGSDYKNLTSFEEIKKFYELF